MSHKHRSKILYVQKKLRQELDLVISYRYLAGLADIGMGDAFKLGKEKGITTRDAFYSMVCSLLQKE